MSGTGQELVLKGKTIYLRPVRLVDVTPRYQGWLGDPAVNQFLDSRLHPPSLEDIEAFVRGIIASPDEAFFAIRLNDSDEHVGNVRLESVHLDYKRANVGILIGEKSCWGKGIATEAISLVAQYAFERRGLLKLNAACFVANRGSARVFEKAGFQREGILRDQGIIDGKQTDAIFLGMTAGDYAKRKAPAPKSVGGRYRESEALLVRAQKTIPLGTQTFSKSKIQYPFGVSPYFVDRARGSRVWDVDGNEYVDYVGALAAINLGYNDPDVTAAVKNQLEDGVIFTLPHPIEMQVAEKFAEMVPCAEMVRFGKNGSDATAGAVRLARAHTGRDHVAVCGYHGWQDWFIGSTARNRGVPKSTRELTHAFAYNQIDSLNAIFKTHRDSVAAVILEPMNYLRPQDGFLEKVKDLTHKNGAVLVFDETITGFRYAKGGAQEYFGVTPDLATFGKGMANGYPVSAIAGRGDLMKLMEEIFFSFTFGGETLSLAAAHATMSKIQRLPVIETLCRQGEKILSGAQILIDKHGLSHVLSVSGHPAWSFLIIKDAGGYNQMQIKTLFLQEVFARGVLTMGTHNMSYAHSDTDVSRLLVVYDEVFSVIKKAVDGHELAKLLRCEVLEPLYKLR